MGVHRQVEAAVEAAREFLCASAHLARTAVHVKRQADHQRVGLPFAQQRLDLLPIGYAVLRLEHAQLAGLAGHDLADGDADLLGAIVEAEQQPRHAHAWPTWVLSRRRSTPSEAAAACRR